MLKISLTQGEYLTIGDNIVVQLYRSEGGRSYLAIDAPREIPIVRGAVLEREGGQRPSIWRRSRRRDTAPRYPFRFHPAARAGWNIILRQTAHVTKGHGLEREGAPPQRRKGIILAQRKPHNPIFI